MPWYIQSTGNSSLILHTSPFGPNITTIYAWGMRSKGNTSSKPHIIHTCELQIQTRDVHS